MDLSWLIVGGGIHGVHVAVRLLMDGGVRPDQLRIVDPGQRLLSRWRAGTAITGMPFLRSPSMHHIDTDPYSLEHFARTLDEPASELFTSPNDRPSTALFEAHCAHVVQRLGLDALHVQDAAASIRLGRDAVDVRLGGGTSLTASRVVLALGSGDQLTWPGWAARDEPRVQHVFQPGFRRPAGSSRILAVIGGGITAAQVAVGFARRGHQVQLISRHAPRTRPYDSDPGWFGPKYMTGYEATSSPRRRRAMITSGRNRGTMPVDVRARLEQAVRELLVTPQVGEVEALDRRGRQLGLTLDDGRRLDVDEVLLATGYTGRRPGGALVDELIARHGLPVAPCGYPVVDQALRWHPRVHVTGALAELEVGPIARNIAGGRRAGDRIVQAARMESVARPLVSKAV